MSNDLEEISEGQSIKRGPDGKIIEAHVSSERAREMRAVQSRKKKSEIETARDLLLIEAGYDPPNSAPEHLKQLATQAVGGRSGAVSALVQFLKLTDQMQGDARAARPGAMHAAKRPRPGEVCPVCGHIVIPAEIADLLLKVIEQIRKKRGDITEEVKPVYTPPEPEASEAAPLEALPPGTLEDTDGMLHVPARPDENPVKTANAVAERERIERLEYELQFGPIASTPWDIRSTRARE